MASAFFAPRASQSSRSYDDSSNPYNPNPKESWEKDNPYESYKPRSKLGGFSTNNSGNEDKFAKYTDWVKTLRNKTSISQPTNTDTPDNAELINNKPSGFSMFGSQQGQYKSLFGNRGNYPKFKRYI